MATLVVQRELPQHGVSLFLLQECWDKDIFSDDFMGSVQFTDNDLRVFDVRNSVLNSDHTLYMVGIV